MGSGQLGRMLRCLKSKLARAWGERRSSPAYGKIDKSESMRMEIRSRQARKLIAETLKIADSPGRRSYAF